MSNQLILPHRGLATLATVLDLLDPSRVPTPEEWPVVIEVYAAPMIDHAESYDFRAPRTNDDVQTDRLLASYLAGHMPEHASSGCRLIHIEQFTTGFYLTLTGHWLVVEMNIDMTQVLRCERCEASGLVKYFTDRPMLPHRLVSGINRVMRNREDALSRQLDRIHRDRVSLAVLQHRLDQLPDPCPVSSR